MSYEDIAQHIRKKVTNVNVNNPKANWGARVLKELDFDSYLIDDILYWVVNTMQIHFNTNSPTNPSGKAGLTMISMAVGGHILSNLNHEAEGKHKLIDEVRVGDLFLEPFVKYGFIELDPPPDIDAMYMVKVTDRWPELGDEIDPSEIEYIHDSPIDDGCRIKGEEHKRSQNVVWRQSATKLMGVPWRINRPVYEALVANKDMFVSEVTLEDEDLNIRRASKLMDYKITMMKADKYIGKTFYQEMEADYRGRLYYRESFLNFQGSDWSRGMLLFGEAKPLDDAGLEWMAIHTANSFNQSYQIDEIPEWCAADYRSYLESEELDSISVDKFTLDDRLRWFNENRDWIADAGRDKKFYPNCEKPVSFLACCIEWHGVIDLGMSMSHLPIPIDGSNNGWQHLGAISKDARTGELVGLVAQEIQKDFYVSTAKKLLEIDDPKLNAMPMKHIRKGVSKRGSMTRAYSAGAGKIGENMWYDCKTEDFHVKYDIEEKDCRRWANELIKAINVVCPGPLQTMEYMQKLAAWHIGTYKKYRDGKPAGTEYFEIRKELNNFFSIPAEDRDKERIEFLIKELKEFYSVLQEGNGERRIKWTTPSGFPVVYEAYREDDFKCRGRINGKQIKHVLKIKTDIPDIRSYMCGISPNYIHSMDAAHMALVISEWDDKSFGAVHDSFSTHACDVEDLLQLTKKKFVEMYNVDNFFDKIRQDITGGTDDIEQPELGTLDVSGVYNSDYFFA